MKHREISVSPFRHVQVLFFMAVLGLGIGVLHTWLWNKNKAAAFSKQYRMQVLSITPPGSTIELQALRHPAVDLRYIPEIMNLSLEKTVVQP